MGVSLAEIIRARRIVRGMERQDLAAAVGCDVRTVRRWECGCRPMTRHMPTLRKALDIPMEEMDRIMLEVIRDRDGGLRSEVPEFLGARGLSHRWLAETLLEMDRRLIGTHPSLGVHNPDQWEPVFKALPDAWRVLTHRGEIVGNWQFLPLASEAHEEMRAGRLTEAQIRLDHLVSLDLPGEVSVNVAALVVAPTYRKGRGLVMLLRSLAEVLRDLARRGVQVATISANAWTPEAVLLRNRLGMCRAESVTSGGGIIFEAKPSQVENTSAFPDFGRERRQRLVYANG